MKNKFALMVVGLLICLFTFDLSFAGLGDGQTWSLQSRKANRAYQNTTGQAIQVQVQVFGTGLSPYRVAWLRVGPTERGPYVVVSGYNVMTGVLQAQTMLAAIVPDQMWYNLLLSPGFSVANWSELR